MAGGKVIDKDRGWQRIMGMVDSLKGGLSIKVGVLDDDKGSAREPGSDLTVAEIAVIQEYGSQDGHTPERSFLRSTFDRKQAELQANMEVLAGKVLDGKIDAVQAMGLLGAKLAAETKKTITAGAEVPPPNAPSTLRRKVHAGVWNSRGKAQRQAAMGPRTLVFSGTMVNAITWQVVTDKEQGK